MPAAGLPFAPPEGSTPASDVRRSVHEGVLTAVFREYVGAQHAGVLWHARLAARRAH